MAQRQTRANRRGSRAWMAIPWLCAVAPSAALAAIYHVAPPPAGSDGNPGTLEAPWATLQHAAATVVAGDTVRVRAGDYAGFHLVTSGSPGAPITFEAFPGERPSITAHNPVTGQDGINLEGASHVVVEGFRVDGRARAGIRAVLCSHVTIRDNRCNLNGRWGIFTGFCDDVRIESNVTSRSVLEHGIYVSNSGDRPLIRGNLAWGNHANGIHLNGDAGQGGDGIISDALVEGNVLFGNGSGGGSGINMDGVQGSVIRNNLIFDTHASGISLYRIDGGGPSSGNQLLHNTVVVAGDGRWGLNIRNASTGNTVKNNTFYSHHAFRGAMAIDADSLPGLVSDHNAVEDRFTTDQGTTTLTLAQWRTATGQDQGSFVAAPAELFLAPECGDHRLRPESPALDAGAPLPTVTVDLLGTPRPFGPGWDVGAYEKADLFSDGFECGDLRLW
jgi:hypothetical protein